MTSPSEPSGLWSTQAWREKARRVLYSGVVDPAAHLLAGTGLTPNKVTLAGGALSVAAGLAVSRGYLFAGGVLVLASGALDLLDGALARVMGKKSKFGAVLDSTLDRVSEASVLFGLLVLYTGIGSTPRVLLVYGTLVGSVLVSYIRARAEGEGVDCRVGVLTRSERTIIMALGLLLGRVPPALLTLALLSYVTAGQRLLHVRRVAAEES
ncbi:MAG: CDP-alcohol phosphatidyltransferase family protein [Dehalococcoidia bacterium]